MGNLQSTHNMCTHLTWQDLKGVEDPKPRIITPCAPGLPSSAPSWPRLRPSASWPWCCRAGLMPTRLPGMAVVLVIGILAAAIGLGHLGSAPAGSRSCWAAPGPSSCSCATPRPAGHGRRPWRRCCWSTAAASSPGCPSTTPPGPPGRHCWSCCRRARRGSWTLAPAWAAPWPTWPGPAGTRASAGSRASPLTFLAAWLRTRPSRDNCQVRWGNLWQEDLGAYDVVYAFLSPAPMPDLWAKAVREMKPGSLLVSNTFTVPGHEPARRIPLPGRKDACLLVWQF